jgi:hypothetical protein
MAPDVGFGQCGEREDEGRRLEAGAGDPGS